MHIRFAVVGIFDFKFAVVGINQIQIKIKIKFAVVGM